MNHPEPDRLADKDPWATVEEARAQRGPLVAGWLNRLLGHQPTGIVRRRRTKRGMPTGLPTGAVGLLTMLPLALSYMLSYLFRNVNGVVAPDIMRDS